MILKIKNVPLITPSGDEKGKELVTMCPKILSKVNIKKSCAKCIEKKKLSYKNKEVDCSLADRVNIDWMDNSFKK
ncbi:MAG: hypothetical protein ACOC2W_03635 [bacterium]